MKKLWIGIGILIVLLALGIGSATVIRHVHGDLAHRLEQAADLSYQDWASANALADTARASWQQHRHWIAALVEHEPLEEIAGLFDQLALSQRSRDPIEFAAVCLQIAGICTMLEESHSPCWWNLL